MSQKERLLLEQIHKTNRLHGLFREGDRLLLALSGGADSAAMAGLLASMAGARRLKLSAAHLNHGLSSHAPALERAARETAEMLGIPFHAEQTDVADLARREKISLEEAGREARYDFFVKLARQLHTDTVATAHTRDDQVETVLFRIFRGTSLRGLSGIPYARLERGMRVIRPLLDCEKEDLAHYAVARNLPFRADPANRSPRHRRNRIRHELLPFLEKRLNPRVREAIVSLQKSWLELSPTVSDAVERAWKACRARQTKQSLTLDRAAFAKLDDALKQEVFVKAVEKIGAGRKALRRVHAEAARFLAQKTRQAASHFPGFTVTADGKKLVWRRKRSR